MRGWQAVLHRAMRYLPVEATSAIGSMLVRANVRINRPSIAHNARRNVKLHHPAMSDAEVDRTVRSFLDNVGRLMAEFSVLDKLMPRQRITFSGGEAASANVGRMPTIALVLHIGNWEVLAPGMQKLGIPIATFYEPPADLFQRAIAEDTRLSFGMRLLTPDRQGVHDALALLRENGTVAIFPDEARRGKTMAPLFGRPPHDRGNLAIAAKLARKTGAQIVVAYSRRIKGAWFRLCFEPPIVLPVARNGILADVALLNALIEPIILRNLDQWYYLDDSVEPL